MRKHERALDFMEMRPGVTITGRCTLCKRVFSAKPKADERTDDTALRVRAEFDSHKCKGLGDK